MTPYVNYTGINLTKGGGERERGEEREGEGWGRESMTWITLESLVMTATLLPPASPGTGEKSFIGITRGCWCGPPVRTQVSLSAYTWEAQMVEMWLVGLGATLGSPYPQRGQDRLPWTTPGEHLPTRFSGSSQGPDHLKLGGWGRVRLAGVGECIAHFMESSSEKHSHKSSQRRLELSAIQVRTSLGPWLSLSLLQAHRTEIHGLASGNGGERRQAPLIAHLWEVRGQWELVNVRSQICRKMFKTNYTRGCLLDLLCWHCLVS